MQQKIISTIEWAASASKAGTAHFGETVQTLMEAGIESYHADYRVGRTTYYLPDGDTHTVTLEVASAGIAERFDTAAIIAAIKGSQRGEVKYPEFLSLSSASLRPFGRNYRAGSVFQKYLQEYSRCFFTRSHGVADLKNPDS